MTKGNNLHAIPVGQAVDYRLLQNATHVFENGVLGVKLKAVERYLLSYDA